MNRLEGARSIFSLGLIGAIAAQLPLWFAASWLLHAGLGTGAVLAVLAVAETALLVLIHRDAWGRARTPQGPLPQVTDSRGLEAKISRRERQLRVAQARSQSAEHAIGSLQIVAGECLDLMRDSCETLRRTANDVSRAALRISTETTTFTVTAEDADRKIADVAASGRDFVDSISRIGECATQSARRGEEASGQIATAMTTIEELQSTSEMIGTMTVLISRIAGQTNLLALNATIEAARAGEQGRGFAVVAGEVKALAMETGKAVAAIGDMVAKIRGSTDRTVAAIAAITSSLSDLNKASAEIASAVDERVEAAGRMVDGVTETATCVAFVASAIKTIEVAVDETMQDAGFLHATADEIARHQDTIRGSLSLCAESVGSATTEAGAGPDLSYDFDDEHKSLEAA